MSAAAVFPGMCACGHAHSAEHGRCLKCECRIFDPASLADRRLNELHRRLARRKRRFTPREKKR